MKVGPATALAPIDPPIASVAPSASASTEATPSGAKRLMDRNRQAALLEQSNEMNLKMLNMLGGGSAISAAPRDGGPPSGELRFGMGTSETGRGGPGPGSIAGINTRDH